MPLRPFATAFVVAVSAAALGAGCVSCPTSWGPFDPCPSTWGKAGPAATAPAAATGAPIRIAGLPEVTILGQPETSDWATFNRLGYRTVVNFRTSAEGADAERGHVVSNGMTYFHVPVEGANLTTGDADALAKILAGTGNDRVLLHCSTGNRAAAVWAVYLARHQGWSADQAVAAGDAAGVTKDTVRAAVRTTIAGN